MSEYIYGYKVKTDGALGEDNYFGITGFDKVQHLNNGIADFTLEQFYNNYRNFIDNGNFVVASENEPTTDIKPKIWLQQITL